MTAYRYWCDLLKAAALKLLSVATAIAIQRYLIEID
jgi:hypothetical protein